MLNKIILMGRIASDPQLKVNTIGTSICAFSIAVDRDFLQGEKRETDFFDCVSFRGTAEFVSRFFTKGKMIAVVGRLQQRTYTDKAGQKRRATEVVVESAYFGESKRSEEATDVGVPQFKATDDADFEEMSTDDPLPF